MPRKQEIRNGDISFDLTHGDAPNEVYVDGVSQVLFGAPISKVTFHTITRGADSQGVEQRFANLTIAVPTHNLVEFCHQILLTMSSDEAKQRMKLGYTNAAKKFDELVDESEDPGAKDETA